MTDKNNGFKIGGLYKLKLEEDFGVITDNTKQIYKTEELLNGYFFLKEGTILTFIRTITETHKVKTTEGNYKINSVYVPVFYYDNKCVAGYTSVNYREEMYEEVVDNEETP